MNTIRQGLPAAGSTDRFQAFDKDGNLYVIRWNEEAGCFCGFGFDPSFTRPLGYGFALKGDMAEFIVSHALPANVIESDVQDEQYRQISAHPRSARNWRLYSPDGRPPKVYLEDVLQPRVIEAFEGPNGFVLVEAKAADGMVAFDDAGNILTQALFGRVEFVWGDGTRTPLAPDE